VGRDEEGALRVRGGEHRKGRGEKSGGEQRDISLE